MSVSKKGGLGRGLDALFADAVPVKEEIKTPQKNKSTHVDEEISPEAVRYLSVHDIMPNEAQPRKAFDEQKIDELAASIRENGIIQPLIVRKTQAGYEIVAGERRWRAAIRAELTKVPCIIKTLSDEQNMLFAIIENMQREDLNPIEEAEGLSRMMFTFGLTQEEVSKSVGKSRPYIGNSLRLLKLPDYIKEAMSAGKISMGHGRALITIADEDYRKRIAERIINEGLSVRETEKLAARGARSKKKPSTKSKNADLLKVEAGLKEALGTRVQINRVGKKGRIEIEFFSKDELERLIELLMSL